MKKIQGNGVELSLPGNFEGGNPSTDMDAIANKLKAINPDLEKGLEPIKQNPSGIALLAFDPQSVRSGFLTNVNIRKPPVPPGTSIEKLMEAASKELSTQFDVGDKQVVSLDKYQAGRIVAQPKAAAGKVKQLFYAIKEGDNFWLVTYSTTASEFEQRLPAFEQSIRTFAVKS
ncbi:hypothetical protein [Microcoleus sp. FACHB-831]|uniref:hypothetical protein n=1 Tax=Microcoleus sp. FACHB-831 TaxID=2692827 RepID=UPI001F548BE0|nr:hypothetical protein [Microcoleus sp. FACHB-831]